MASHSLNFYFVTVLVVLLAGICLSLPTFKRPKAACGYESCASVDPYKLNVHLVPHSHDDVGWLKTVDQYFYGARTDIQRAGVQYILDSVIDALWNNPERRFIYVETAFFWKWWVEQSEERQQVVRDLVNEGRLEFIGGAWSMNDEAASHYHSTIDQFTWGLRKLDDIFGECGRPHVGWQIDPFGHSREMASLLARMGYDGLFFARLDYQDKSRRRQDRELELVWEGSATIGSDADLFTSVLYNHYSAPGGFCFDVLCSDTPMIDDERSPDFNIEKRVEDFVTFANNQAQYYTTNNILITMGDDFHYQDANMNFKNMDKLIKYVNAADVGVNVIYSTPSCYLKAVNDVGNTYTVKSDDFFPYASDPNSYWTGYFTSRTTSKNFERLGNNFLQIVKQLEAMTQLGQSDTSQIDDLRGAMGVMQHHDAITGTEKQHVAEDYARMLSSAFDEAGNAARSHLNVIMSGDPSSADIKNCLQLNVSKCDVSENEERFVITVYNPLSHSVNHFVRAPVPEGVYTVQDPSGYEVATQMVPIPQEVLQVPERENSNSKYDLVFKAADLPPLGYRSYYVTKTSDYFEGVETSSDDFIGDTIKANLDTGTGLIRSVVNNDVEIPLTQNFYYYEGFNDNNNGATHRSSGAYVFRPIDSTPQPVVTEATTTVYKGDIVEEIHQQFSSYISQVVRIYKEENHVEFEWLVGPIPTDDEVGKEIISRFSSDLQTEGVFYTDSNGRELLERKRDYRPTWDVTIDEPASGNYYPVTSKILIRDQYSELEVAVLNDRAQGGSSLNDGEVELMLHRRLMHDDAFGVGEALDEQAFGQGLVARGKHYLVAGSINGPSPNLAAQERELAQRKLLSPWSFFMAGGSSFEEWQSYNNMEFAGLTRSLPINVQILTLEPWKDQTLLLRLEHILENNEDPELSQPVDIEYEDLFSTFTISSSRETSLGGNQWLEDMSRLVWNKPNKLENRKSPSSKESRAVSLQPMGIGTYVIEVNTRLEKH